MLENPRLTPKHLDLLHNNIGNYGSEIIARLLPDLRCTMEVLEFHENKNIDNNWAHSFANALKRNTTLGKLILDRTSITSAGGYAVFC